MLRRAALSPRNGSVSYTAPCCPASAIARPSRVCTKRCEVSASAGTCASISGSVPIVSFDSQTTLPSDRPPEPGDEVGEAPTLVRVEVQQHRTVEDDERRVGRGGRRDILKSLQEVAAHDLGRVGRGDRCCRVQSRDAGIVVRTRPHQGREPGDRVRRRRRRSDAGRYPAATRRRASARVLLRHRRGCTPASRCWVRRRGRRAWAPTGSRNARCTGRGRGTGPAAAPTSSSAIGPSMSDSGGSHVAQRLGSLVWVVRAIAVAITRSRFSSSHVRHSG